jgi:hypothetical protein
MWTEITIFEFGNTESEYMRFPRDLVPNSAWFRQPRLVRGPTGPHQPAMEAATVNRVRKFAFGEKCTCLFRHRLEGSQAPNASRQVVSSDVHIKAIHPLRVNGLIDHDPPVSLEFFDLFFIFSPTAVKPTWMVASSVVWNGIPQCGHDSASSWAWPSHSGQLSNAIWSFGS